MNPQVKNKILGAVKNIEKNFEKLSQNQEAQRVLKNMKQYSSKRSKQLDKLVNESWIDVKRAYNREVKGMEAFFEAEKSRLNGLLKSQVSELKKMRKAVQEHLKAMGPGKKPAAKKTVRKAKAKRVAKKATRKAAAPAATTSTTTTNA